MSLSKDVILQYLKILETEPTLWLSTFGQHAKVTVPQAADATTLNNDIAKLKELGYVALQYQNTWGSTVLVDNRTISLTHRGLNFLRQNGQAKHDLFK